MYVPKNIHELPLLMATVNCTRFSDSHPLFSAVHRFRHIVAAYDPPNGTDNYNWNAKGLELHLLAQGKHSMLGDAKKKKKKTDFTRCRHLL